jgi:hypothetical protein
MKNREKYAKEIIDITFDRGHVAVSKENKVVCCEEISCKDCIFNNMTGHCSKLKQEWAELEYVEPPVDWTKVAVDTPILVRDSEKEVWEKKHFAKYENGKVYTWGNGATSWSNDGSRLGWEMAKLAEEVES